MPRTASWMTAFSVGIGPLAFRDPSSNHKAVGPYYEVFHLHYLLLGLLLIRLLNRWTSSSGLLLRLDPPL